MSAIVVEHLTLHCAGVTAIRDVSFGVPPGQLTAHSGQLAVTTWLGA